MSIEPTSVRAQREAQERLKELSRSAALTEADNDISPQPAPSTQASTNDTAVDEKPNSAQSLNAKDQAKATEEEKSATKMPVETNPLAMKFIKAAEYGNLAAIKEMLADKDRTFDLNTSDAYGETALHKAALEGNAEIVKLLIENKADVTIQDKEGQTALHEATIEGRTDIARILLKANPSLKGIKDKDGKTALDLAKDNGDDEISQTLTEPPEKPTFMEQIGTAFKSPLLLGALAGVGALLLTGASGITSFLLAGAAAIGVGFIAKSYLGEDESKGSGHAAAPGAGKAKAVEVSHGLGKALDGASVDMQLDARDLDTNKDGELKLDEMAKALKGKGLKIKDTEVKELRDAMVQLSSNITEDHGKVMLKSGADVTVDLKYDGKAPTGAPSTPVSEEVKGLVK